MKFIESVDTFIVRSTFSYYISRKRLPPGPFGLPLVGSLPFIKSDPLKTLFEWSKKYGPVIGLQLGNNPVVILNDWPTIKEALSMDTILDRPKHNFFTSVIPISFAALSGQVWREQRKFTVHQLRNLGFGKTSMEDHIRREITHVCQKIDQNIDRDFEFRKLFSLSISNNVSAFIFGRRLDYESSAKKVIDEFLTPDPKLNLLSVFQFFPQLVGFIFKYLHFLLPEDFRKTRLRVQYLTDYFRSEIKTHSQTLDVNNNRDYIDAYLTEMQKSNISDNSTFNPNTLEGNTFALFAAGSITTTTTLEWAMLALATYPDIQKRLQQEVDEVIGVNSIPEYGYRQHMPYLQAFIHEIIRYRSISPINLPRCAIQDITIGGHRIPKGTQIFVNFWSVENDPILWDKPSEFRPQRFLTNENTFQKPEHFTPFSYGKRSCPGEVLAMAELFLYLTTFLQKYDILATDKTDKKLEYLFAFSLIPKHIPVIKFTKRNHQ
ncbi:cytochrome P450 2J3-like [Oppia nitens]|uniref:cytochrome P450 2J3-like n=1 Tax=Oppia nitens TaxID=1686743 RepID=UPI0023DAC1EE|nr:cytochrome P450 2J3-like [Oppia nitens]